MASIGPFQPKAFYGSAISPGLRVFPSLVCPQGTFWLVSASLGHLWSNAECTGPAACGLPAKCPQPCWLDIFHA